MAFPIDQQVLRVAEETFTRGHPIIQRTVLRHAQASLLVQVISLSAGRASPGCPIECQAVVDGAALELVHEKPELALPAVLGVLDIRVLAPLGNACVVGDLVPSFAPDAPL